MAQNQKKLNVNVSFENELAQYLTDMVEMQNKTILRSFSGFRKRGIRGRDRDDSNY